MATDASAGENGDSTREDATLDGDEDLTFAAHDLGRERAPRPDLVNDEHGFALAPRPLEDAPNESVISFVGGGRDAPGLPAPDQAPAPAPSPRARPADGFVIREPQGAAPMAPVDALVVGARTPAAGEAPATSPAEATPFKISAHTSVVGTDRDAEPLWIERTRAAEPAAAAMAERRGWSTRPSHLTDRSAQATVLRLREEAVHVSWNAAWIAVTAADPRLSRKRAS
jgi:hypothetical protein